MTTPRRLRLIANAGDPDDALPIRIDVVTAAMGLLKAHEKAMREGMNDPQSLVAREIAIANLLTFCRRYRRSLSKRVA